LVTDPHQKLSPILEYLKKNSPKTSGNNIEEANEACFKAPDDLISENMAKLVIKTGVPPVSDPFVAKLYHV
jgi:hypothetical protein